tara:strand:- start:2408 stop:2794 length:387 start_codon:yes stop_codon:yes gene_type:complete
MTWAATKIFFKKAFAWCVQHWRWLVFASVTLIAYLTGRKNARSLWQQAELARKQYKREAAAIERAHSKKSERIKKAEAQAQKDLADAAREKNKLEKDLEAKKRREMMRLVKDQDRIDKALKDSGIDEV